MTASTAIVLVLVVGVAAQWLAWRIRLPAIVFLLAIGLVVGPLTGWVDPGALFGDLLDPVVALFVAVILFEGGLSLRRHEIGKSAVGVRRLVYMGAPLNLLFGAAAAHWIADLPWPVAIVFGAITVVTGPTVILPLLRQAGLNKRTASYLKWEGIINDPIGALAAVLAFQYFVLVGAGSGAASVTAGFGTSIVVGVVVGGFTGWLIGHAFREGMVPEYLKAPSMLAVVLLVYVVSNGVQHESGLLSVTLMGVVVGNMRLPSIEEMRRFKEYLTILLVSAVFILLTANLDPEILARLGWRDILLIAAVMLVVRPAAVLIATHGAGMELRERLLVGWVAPRGIVAAATAGVFGPRMVEAGYPEAALLLPLIFVLIIVTVMVHGLSLGPLARKLELAAPPGRGLLIVGATPWSIEFARLLKQQDVEVLLADRSWHSLKPARLAGIPVYYGEILSEQAEQSLETAPVVTLLAATDNDAYNALVCNAFASELGRNRVFQLPMAESEELDPRGLTHTIHGRIAFHPEEAYWENLWTRHAVGWRLQKTKVTDSYTVDDMLGDRPENAFTVAMIRANGSLELKPAQDSLSPDSGDTVIYFAPPKRDREATV
jgi:NhaP-type Na+/H+ or K+/H+ antiporter